MSKRQQNEEQPSEPQQAARAVAEWVVLGVSVFIVLGVLGLLVYDLILGSDAPPFIEVMPLMGELRIEGNQFYLPVSVENTGGRTAEDVTVHFVLVADGMDESSSFTFRFMAPGERTRAVVVFNNDPSEWQLEYTVSFLRP